MAKCIWLHEGFPAAGAACLYVLGTMHRDARHGFRQPRVTEPMTVRVQKIILDAEVITAVVTATVASLDETVKSAHTLNR